MSRRRSRRNLVGLLACLLSLAGGAWVAEREVRASAAISMPAGSVALREEPSLVRAAPNVERGLSPATVAAPAPTVEPAAPPEPADVVFSRDEARVRHALGEAFREGRIVTGATPHRLILFTFDDGPDRRTTPRLLRHLDELGVRAVFFVTTQRLHHVGARAAAERALLRDITRRGHMIGNHTVNHEQLPLLDTPTVLAELLGTEDVLLDELGARTWLARPPGGSRSPRVDRVIAGQGYTQLLWNLGTGDFQVRDADAVVETFVRVLERREREEGERGGIVLMHDTHDWSVEAFPRIVHWLRQRNCALLDEGEELYDIVDDPSFFYEPLGDADPSSLARPARPDADVLEARQARLRDETARRCRTLASR